MTDAELGASLSSSPLALNVLTLAEKGKTFAPEVLQGAARGVAKMFVGRSDSIVGYSHNPDGTWTFFYTDGTIRTSELHKDSWFEATWKTTIATVVVVVASASPLGPVGGVIAGAAVKAVYAKGSEVTKGTGEAVVTDAAGAASLAVGAGPNVGGFNMDRRMLLPLAGAAALALVNPIAGAGAAALVLTRPKTPAKRARGASSTPATPAETTPATETAPPATEAVPTATEAAETTAQTTPARPARVAPTPAPRPAPAPVAPPVAPARPGPVASPDDEDAAELASPASSAVGSPVAVAPVPTPVRVTTPVAPVPLALPPSPVSTVLATVERIAAPAPIASPVVSPAPTRTIARTPIGTIFGRRTVVP